MGRIKVLIAEDHPLMQATIAGLLCAECEVVDIIADGDKILDAVSRARPDVVVLDISLPGRSGLQVLPVLREAHPAVAAIVLTTHASPQYREEAFNRGADAYILKDDATRELLPALHQAISTRLSGTSQSPPSA